MKKVIPLTLLILLTSCGTEVKTIFFSGVVRDQKTQQPIPSAWISIGSGDSGGVATDHKGFFLIRIPDTLRSRITISADRYKPTDFSFPPEFGRDSLSTVIELQKIPDTAFTALGPVDATFFLSDTLLRRKKLSKNEAKRIALQEMTGGKIMGMELTREGNRVVWIFDIQHGKDMINVVLDAYTGKILSKDGDPSSDSKRRREKLSSDDE